MTNDNESEDEDDLMDNEETHNDNDDSERFSVGQKFRHQDDESAEEEENEEEQEDEDRDEQETDSSDNNEDDDDASAPNPGTSHAQSSRSDTSSKETESKRSHQPHGRSESRGPMDAECDEDDDEPKTVVSNSEKSRAKKSKRIEFQKRQDDSDNDADERLEDKIHSNSKQTNQAANTSASFVLVNEFKSSTYTPESSMLPIIDQLTAAPKSKKKLTKLPTNMFEAFSFKKSLHMNHERPLGDDEEDEDTNEVNESDLMSTTIDTTKNDTIPFLNQSQMSINKSIQSGAQINVNNNKHLSFNQTSASMHDQLMDSVDEDL